MVEPSAVRRLKAGDVDALQAISKLFGDVFQDPDSYHRRVPRRAYLKRLLQDDGFIALTASLGDEVVGGLAAYVLRKFEQERSEVYIYDLAVAGLHRRRGVATALIDALKPIARTAGAWVIYVQADPPDEPAVALYRKLGVGETVLHFDIAIE